MLTYACRRSGARTWKHPRSNMRIELPREAGVEDIVLHPGDGEPLRFRLALREADGRPGNIGRRHVKAAAARCIACVPGPVPRSSALPFRSPSSSNTCLRSSSSSGLNHGMDRTARSWYIASQRGNSCCSSADIIPSLIASMTGLLRNTLFAPSCPFTTRRATCRSSGVEHGCGRHRHVRRHPAGVDRPLRPIDVHPGDRHAGAMEAVRRGDLNPSRRKSCGTALWVLLEFKACQPLDCHRTRADAGVDPHAGRSRNHERGQMQRPCILVGLRDRLLEGICRRDLALVLEKRERLRA